MERTGPETQSADAAFAEALALHQDGRLDEAVACYRSALALRPDHADAHGNLGLVLQRQGRLDDALSHYEAAVAIEPRLARAHNNRGAALQTLGRFEEAAASHRAALAIDPAYVGAQMNLGGALHQQGRLEEAAAWYRSTLTLQPDHAEAEGNLGLALQALGRPADALPHLEAALAVKPAFVEVYNTLGLALRDLARLEPALAAFERAITLMPDYAEAHMNLGMARLLAGDFAGGWLEYDWRLKRKGIPQPHRPGPLWDGGPLSGQTILLQGEQGLGDTIQFVRYAPLVAERGGRVVLSCRPSLKSLFQGMDGIHQVIEDGEPAPAFTCWTPLLSLPGLFATQPETIPAAGPYLKADPRLADCWRERLTGRQGFKVGVVWRGSPGHADDRRRSMPPALLAKALAGADLAVVSLQKDARPEELQALGADVLDAGPDLADFSQTAALIARLDLLISVDTAVAHLAGALSKPIWLLNRFDTDWRWLLDRTDSPWYSSLRLFRQPSPGDWTSVMDEVRAALERRVRD
jgi:tetratricopeptide (TPR) repeat protein